MLKFAGFDTGNPIDFLRKSVERGEALTNAERELYKKLGIDIDVILDLDPIDVRKLDPQIIIPTALKEKLESPAPPGCFPGDTLIALPGGGARRIDAIDVGDRVLTFDPLANGGRGALLEGVVTRTFRNVTQEWLRVDFAPSADGTTRRPLIATPGHEMLCPEGGFARLDQMVAWAGADRQGGTVTIVNQDAGLSSGQVSRISYSAATADMFEQAMMLAEGGSDGNLALKPKEVSGWRTYNFEVSGTLTPRPHPAIWQSAARRGHSPACRSLRARHPPEARHRNGAGTPRACAHSRYAPR